MALRSALLSPSMVNLVRRDQTLNISKIVFLTFSSDSTAIVLERAFEWTYSHKIWFQSFFSFKSSRLDIMTSWQPETPRIDWIWLEKRTSPKPKIPWSVFTSFEKIFAYKNQSFLYPIWARNWTERHDDICYKAWPRLLLTFATGCDKFWIQSHQNHRP